MSTATTALVHLEQQTAAIEPMTSSMPFRPVFPRGGVEDRCRGKPQNPKPREGRTGICSDRM